MLHLSDALLCVPGACTTEMHLEIVQEFAGFSFKTLRNASPKCKPHRIILITTASWAWWLLTENETGLFTHCVLGLLPGRWWHSGS